MNKFILILCTLVCSATTCFSVDTLYLADFLKVIHTNHPLIKKANLFDEFSEAYAIKGRGALDPKVLSDYQQKKFSDTDYFTVWQSELKIPTKLPVDFSLGYENNEGVFLNNENVVPNNGLIYGTINVSLLRGLLFDEQRYQIQATELNGIKSQIDKSLLTREIIHQAVSAYLNWAINFYETEIYQDYFDLVTERHQNVVELFLNGDSPAIDTIESIVNLNTAEKNYLESSGKLISQRQKLNLFIWNENGQPLIMSDNVSPAKLAYLLSQLNELALIMNPFFENDPVVKKIQNEIESLTLANRIEREQLKPQLDLKYNTVLNLGKDNFDPSFAIHDYKYGVTFEYPILNRKTKGELQLNQALIDQSIYEKTQYEESLINKYIGLKKRQVIQQDVLEIVNQKIINSERLYEAESLKFELGESSIFLLNQRERKMLEARTEQIKSFWSIGKLLNELYYLSLGQN